MDIFYSDYGILKHLFSTDIVPKQGMAIVCPLIRPHSHSLQVGTAQFYHRQLRQGKVL